MKSNWIIKTDEANFNKVLELLKKRKIKINTELNLISVLTVNTTEAIAKKLRKLDGVIAVEEEGVVKII
ncbi:MAG: hypothetical protein V9E90_03400 [Saprospiraceae bacterium]